MKHVIVRLLLTAAITCLLAVFIGGCSKKSVIPPSPETSASAGSSGKDINYPAAEGSYSENNLAVEGTLDDTASPQAEHLGSMSIDGTQAEPTPEYKETHGRTASGLVPIYFDFDQAALRPDMSERMIQNADYIMQVPNTVVIEGNCDDRGTKEYNLALGEKRAINIRDYLINLGVNPDQVRTVSYGEERPLFFEQTDFAWGQNRRADFILE